MPLLAKQVLSNYLRSDCWRRLRLDLSPDTQYQPPNGQTARQERQQAGMPPRSMSRLELQALAAPGEEWEEAKINDLVQTFGTRALVGTPRLTPAGTYCFLDTPLANLNGQAAPSDPRPAPTCCAAVETPQSSDS
jgi:hypothetical protein